MRNPNSSPQLRTELQCVSPIIDRFVCIQYLKILSSVSKIAACQIYNAFRKLAHAINRDFFSLIKFENFIRKNWIFFLFLLKT